MALCAALAAAPDANAQSCTSSDPSQWPSPSRPYFMIVVDTSGSMILDVGSSPSCAGYPTSRMGHAKCAVKNTVLAFAGEVNFGLSQYAGYMTNCGPSCYGNNSGTPQAACGVNCFQSEINSTGICGACGPMDNINDATTRRGANILVPMQIDNTWTTPAVGPTSNVQQILQYVDNDCTSSLELTNPPIDGPQYGRTPINGSLRDMRRYFQTGWTNPDNAAISYTTPLNTQDRSCRSVNVILLTDGDETCDTQANAVSAAASLLTGVTVGANTFSIKTYVINFAGGSQANTDAIAAAGGTTSSYFATNETQLSQALTNIIGSAIKPETCDNTDNNCNGCVDEGFSHYCNVQAGTSGCCSWSTTAQRTACGASACSCCSWSTTAQRSSCGALPGGACACCAWTTGAQRDTCLTNFKSSITAQNPTGDLNMLPCTTAAQAQASGTWLCFDPGEKCDDVDNNCSSGIDEGVTKCGNPAHCPTTEVCNGQDDNCNGAVDEGNVCSSTCSVTPSGEVCDGCDNDCNGVADNGISVSLPCGFTGPGEPAYCAGLITCKAPQAVSPPGGCVANGGFTACTYPAPGPQNESCNGLDDDCNGVVDDNIVPTACVPPGTPAGLVYGGTSQCKMGTTQCVNGVTQCVGFVGPSAEICDGLDNNCDGSVDNAIAGLGQTCGQNLPPCSPGTTACVNGAIVCQGGVSAKPEVCNGIDDDCNGSIDDGVLADAPPASANGCWTDPGPCCSFPAVSPTLQWCPPMGAGCNDNGTLTTPCNHGTLVCSLGAWACKNEVKPTAEVCDGKDNNCNGVIDDGVMNLGNVCGSSVGTCKQGTLMCNAGVLTCVGGVDPAPETCDGLDNDCDGTVDNGIPTGPCFPDYDKTLYPGPRTALPCQPGVYQCDGNGNLVCVNGVGPKPEVCDGIDNDCDGLIDEVGAAPDGIDGTVSPIPPPDKIGDACGLSMGTCTQGTFGCFNGKVTCLGGQGGKAEECDCTDNDCDGQVDNPNPNGPPLCSTGKECVKSSFGCGCATPCDITKEFPCPGGQVCQDVVSTQTGMPVGKFCVSDPCGGDCTGKTVTDASNQVVCAPPSTAADPTTCVAPPVCVCKGQNGCKDPCFGVTCTPGSVCAQRGPDAGKCVMDNCWVNPCVGCSKVCNHGACAENPCSPNPCSPEEQCLPSADFTSKSCVPTCTGKSCPSGQTCVHGDCVATCDPCGTGQVCDMTQTPPTCVTDACAGKPPCSDGSFCNPVTGSCGNNDPCAGVVCPSGDVCRDGSCFEGGQGGAGGGTTTGSTGSTSGSTGSANGGAGGAENEKGIWGLATGGGGCSCEVGPGLAERLADARAVLFGLALVLAARRRRGRRGEEVPS